METGSMLYNYALKLLGGRRYTVAGLRKKLNQKLKKLKIDSPEDARRVIGRLTQLHLLDDREYANLYIEDQLRSKPQGIKMLKMRLTAKGLSRDIIGQALQSADLDEQKLAHSAAVKKIKTMTNLQPQKQKEKLARFLSSRGFGTRSIIGALKSFPSDVEEDGRYL